MRNENENRLNVLRANENWPTIACEPYILFFCAFSNAQRQAGNLEK